MNRAAHGSRVHLDPLDDGSNNGPEHIAPARFFCLGRDLGQQARHVGHAHLLYPPCPLGLGFQPLQLALLAGAVALQVVDLAQGRCRVGQVGGHVQHAADLPADGLDLGRQLPARGRGAVAGQRRPGRMHQRRRERRRGDVGQHLVQHLRVDRGPRDRSATAAVAVGLDPPLLAIRVEQQAAKQRAGVAIALAHAGGRPRSRLRLQAPQQPFGRLIVDQGGVRVALDHPFAARPALAAAHVAAALALGVYVPDGVPGIGQGIPFQADQGGVGHGQPGQHLGALPRHLGRAVAQVLADGHRCLRIRLQHRLGDHLALAHGAGGYLAQHVAGRRAATGAKAGAHVLAHARQALLLAGDAVVLVPGHQHRLQHHLGERIDVRQGLVDDGHAVVLAVDLLEHQRDHAPARQARGVVQQHGVPATRRVAHRGQQPLEAGAVGILAALHRIDEFLSDGKAARGGQFMQGPALGVGRNVLAVLAGTQVERGGSLHCDGCLFPLGNRV
ncbi:hypothetical protein [Stenotrophomonas sp. MMGLT7]|uniref:hypothetical protein n=1 Tax=Stenotrophomonas sp. MMGLT7 TaxID=2901227 RepID=UPI001E4B5383|nr:hypothetical protein [Stenotrophomonas sp. MMGLT7]MCD7096954.1 hypothetical protein [Stenotrophomonas sp. MMGLT7]